MNTVKVKREELLADPIGMARLQNRGRIPLLQRLHDSDRNTPAGVYIKVDDVPKVVGWIASCQLHLLAGELRGYTLWIHPQNVDHCARFFEGRTYVVVNPHMVVPGDESTC
jgi:hypothetical protein